VKLENTEKKEGMYGGLGMRSGVSCGDACRRSIICSRFSGMLSA
jgi:hypothetical protein